MADNLTTTEIADLDLFDALTDHVEADEEELLASVVGEGKDSRRRFRGTLRARILKRDKGVCFYCGVRPDRVHIDHVIPHSRGGRTVEANGVVACPPCNLGKSNRVW